MPHGHSLDPDLNKSTVKLLFLVKDNWGNLIMDLVLDNIKIIIKLLLILLCLITGLCLWEKMSIFFRDVYKYVGRRREWHSIWDLL